MKDTEIKFFDGCNNTPIVPYYLKAMLELTKKGLNHGCVSFNYEQKAFAAFKGDKMIGMLLFDDCKWKNTVVVVLGHVRSKHRKKGIYKKLWEALVAWSQKEGRILIEGATSIKNKRMQKVMKAQNRFMTSINYEFKVPKLKD